MPEQNQAQQQLLAALADIQEPPVQSAFYFEPGYLLITLLLIVLAIISWKWWQKRRQQQLPQQWALMALEAIDLHQPSASGAVMLVLKQYIHHLAPNHPSVTYSTDEFEQFIRRAVPSTEPLPSLSYLLYSGQASQAEVATFATYVKVWLQQHPKGLFNV